MQKQTTREYLAKKDQELLEAAKADGWIQHPSSEPHMYKDQEVKAKTELVLLYAARLPNTKRVKTLRARISG